MHLVLASVGARYTPRQAVVLWLVAVGLVPSSPSATNKPWSTRSSPNEALTRPIIKPMPSKVVSCGLLTCGHAVGMHDSKAVRWDGSPSTCSSVGIDLCRLACHECVEQIERKQPCNEPRGARTQCPLKFVFHSGECEGQEEHQLAKSTLPNKHWQAKALDLVRNEVVQALAIQARRCEVGGEEEEECLHAWARQTHSTW